jgi:hypothetical protein
MEHARPVAPLVAVTTAAICLACGETDTAHGRPAASGSVQDASIDSSAGGATGQTPPIDLTPIDAGIPPFVDPLGGASGCDASVAVPRSPCGIMMPVEGELTTTLYAPLGASGCSSSSVGSFGTAAYHDGYQTVVDIFPVSRIVPGQVGVPVPVTVTLVNVLSVSDIAIWNTPTGGCTITLTGNVCGVDFQLVSGTGTCASPALPAPDTLATAPLIIRDFYFGGRIQATG